MSNNSWHWSGSWLYDNVFAKPSATILKDAVEALVEVAQVHLPPPLTPLGIPSDPRLVR
jgi:hypothetical protein